MRGLRAVLAVVAVAATLLPAAVALAADGGRPHEGGARRPAIVRPLRPARPEPARPRALFPFFPFAASIVPGPPVYVEPPPVVYVVVPRPDVPPEAPPLDLTPPTPPVRPAPEVVLPTGRWELHGDGVDWPYVWIWVPAYRPREAAPSHPPPPPRPPGEAARAQ